MLNFVRQLGQRVCGVLSGFDRLLFRGIWRCVIDPRGLNGSLYGAKVALTNYGQHVQEVSRRLKDASLAHAREVGCEIRYLDSSQERKKDIALGIAQSDGIRPGGGLICLLSCVEPCVTFDVPRDPIAKKIALVRRFRKCLHLDHDFDHERFGLMPVRLQTWFPFTMQVCLNGREWLIRDLTKAGIGHLRRDNGVCEVDDLAAAQQFLDEQLTAAWPALWKDFVRQVHPAHESIFANCPEPARDDYWSAAESEWASDVLFRDPADVLPLAERLAAYSLRVPGPGDVMRFLGRTVRADGLPRTSFGGEIHSDTRYFNEGTRSEGLRLKHRLNANSVKMPLFLVNTSGRPGVLRFETTICNPADFKVWRTRENAPADAQPEWLRMRKGIADLHRRAQVRQGSNDRFATAQTAVLHEDSTPLKDVIATLCQRVTRPGHEKPDGSRTRSRTFRALNPLSPDDIRLLTIIAPPKFGIASLRHADVRVAWFGTDPTDDAKELRRRSSAVSRKLALLRAHGLLQKVPKSHHCRVTPAGHQSLTTLLTAANASTTELHKLAA